MRPGWLRWLVKRPFLRAWIYSRSVLARARGRRVVHMLHIGKTGGTALKHALRRHPPEDAGIEVLAHQHDVSLSDLPPWDDLFVVLRDPISRYVSAFNSRLVRGQPRYDVPWTRAERRSFARFGSAEDLALALDDSNTRVRREARRAMRGIRHVNRHYSHWLGSRRRLLARRRHLLLVARKETLDSDFDRLKKLLCLPPDATLPKQDRAANRSPAHRIVGLSEHATANLAAWYRSDYDLLDFVDDELA